MKLLIIPQFFGCMVFDRRTSRYLPFDHRATELLVQSIEQDLDTVVCAHPEALEFFDYFLRAGFFDIHGRLDAEVIDAEPPSDHLLGPLAVHVEVIGACNLTCVHCFADPLPRQRNLLTADELDTLFADLASIGSLRLGLTGGEPLMRPELFDIIDSALDHRLHPCLTTNALLINEHIARELGRRELVWLNVSLDGATAQTNDAIRGEGTFDRVMENLHLLREHARFTLAFTITSQSAQEVDACAQLAKEVGAHTAVFRPLYPVGAARQRPDLMPTFHQYSEALVQLGTSLAPDEDIRGIDPFSPQARRHTQARVTPKHGCGAGNLIASVSVRGQVNPCSFLGPEHDADNIRNRSFPEIWSSSDQFEWMRNESRFQGGCRARSLAFAGDVSAPDPWHGDWLETIELDA